MKNTVLLIALAGLTTTAATAEDFSLSIAGAPTTIDATNGATITIDIIGDSSHGEFMISGFYSMVSGSELISNMSWIPVPWAFNLDDGYAGNGDYNLVGFAQFPFQFDPAQDSALGSAIGSFQIQIAAGSFGVIDFNILAGPEFTLETAFGENQPPPMGGAFDYMNDTEPGNNLILNGASINVVPAPSSLALLGLGGLAASRRRR
ncbi:MAG: PEP-CTERM sorting domain-containing protein [Phycisphaerales bacterium]|nr:PEP-CTERM sorting domain-containing protein [Phycisphaerales bacterium]